MSAFIHSDFHNYIVISIHDSVQSYIIFADTNTLLLPTVTCLIKPLVLDLDVIKI
jgi:hypothetical protein